MLEYDRSSGRSGLDNGGTLGISSRLSGFGLAARRDGGRSGGAERDRSSGRSGLDSEEMLEISSGLSGFGPAARRDGGRSGGGGARPVPPVAAGWTARRCSKSPAALAGSGSLPAETAGGPGGGARPVLRSQRVGQRGDTRNLQRPQRVRACCPPGRRAVRGGRSATGPSGRSGLDSEEMLEISSGLSGFRLAARRDGGRSGGRSATSPPVAAGWPAGGHSESPAASAGSGSLPAETAGGPGGRSATGPSGRSGFDSGGTLGISSRLSGFGSAARRDGGRSGAERNRSSEMKPSVFVPYPSTGPRPLARVHSQEGFDRVILDVPTSDKFVFTVPHVGVPEILAPEMSATSQELVRLPGGVLLPVRYGPSHRLISDPKQHMDVVRHHHPSTEFIACTVVKAKRFLNQLANLRPAKAALAPPPDPDTPRSSSGAHGRLRAQVMQPTRTAKPQGRHPRGRRLPTV